MADAGALATVLANPDVRLEPLGSAHLDALRAACAEDQDIWEIYPYSMLGEHFDSAMVQRAGMAGWVQFAVLDAGGVVGTTCYIRPDPVHGVVEIGGTYIAPRVRGTKLNRAMKQLLIDHAFACGFRRIEFRVDARNQRSQAAVLKLGAVREGLLRNNMITWTGFVRSTCLFGLMREEWAE